jgi:pilus assembly protein Flp/PilA
MLKNVMKFLKDEEGASAVEYGLVVGLIAVALVVIMGLFSGSLGTAFTTISNTLPH